MVSPSRKLSPERIIVVLIIFQWITFKLFTDKYYQSSSSTTNDKGVSSPVLPEKESLSNSTNNNDTRSTAVTKLSSLHSTASADDTTVYPVHGPREVRVLAIVFPQFHSDPLNNKLWGTGFTDWDNLRKAPARNRLGYGIPRPLSWDQGGLGYYNYTSYSVRKRQAVLARKHGIDGFIFHHYWFYDPAIGGATLKAPLEAMLQDGEPNIPFFLNWCAMKWSFTWLSKTQDDEGSVLQHQYFPQFDTNGKPKTPDDLQLLKEHYQWLSQFFKLDNYIKVNGKPVLMTYQRKPGLVSVLKQFKEFAKDDGFPGLYLIVGLTRPHAHLQRFVNIAEYQSSIARKKYVQIYDTAVMYPNPVPWFNTSLELPHECLSETKTLQRTRRQVAETAGIMTSFDNTPRMGLEAARIWSPASTEEQVQRFGDSLEAALTYEQCCFPNDPKTKEDRFIVINAMNEWAEAMVLEPSDIYQYQFLEEVKRRKAAINCNTKPSRQL